MRALRILILSDGRPGHYHLAEGVAAAVARRRPVEVVKVAIERRRAIPGRVLAWLLSIGTPPAAVLRVGYRARIDPAAGFDLILSAGGDTIAANVAAARLFSAANIFCGTLRRLAPTAFSLVVSSYARHAGLPRHIVALKPNGIDPDTLARPTNAVRRATGDMPKIAGLLIGGDSGYFHYTDAEWQRLADFIAECHRQTGIKWVVSTSRRSPDAVGDVFLALSRQESGPIAEFIDFRTAGPGTLARLFAGVEAVLCTEDSSTMISEAVCARLPVVGVSPENHGFKDDEREYREFMKREGWCHFVRLADLDVPAFVDGVARITPLRENHIDKLADQLAERLPQLFNPDV